MLLERGVTENDYRPLAVQCSQGRRVEIRERKDMIATRHGRRMRACDETDDAEPNDTARDHGILGALCRRLIRLRSTFGQAARLRRSMATCASKHRRYAARHAA